MRFLVFDQHDKYSDFLEEKWSAWFIAYVRRNSILRNYMDKFYFHERKWYAQLKMPNDEINNFNLQYNRTCIWLYFCCLKRSYGNMLHHLRNKWYFKHLLLYSEIVFHQALYIIHETWSFKFIPYKMLNIYSLNENIDLFQMRSSKFKAQNNHNRILFTIDELHPHILVDFFHPNY